MKEMPKKKTIVIIAVILLVLLVGYFHFCGIEIDRKFVITSVATENALDDKLPVTIKGKLKLNLDITWQFTGNIIIDGYEMTQNEAKYLLQLQLRHSQKMPGLLVGHLIYIDPQLLWMEGCVGQIYTDLLFNKFIFLPTNETTIYVVE